MNSLLSRLSNKFTKYTIDDITICIKNISFAEFTKYRDFASTMSENDQVILINAKYILDNFISDENGNKFNSDDLSEIPLSFLVSLTTTFNEHIQNSFSDKKK